MPLLGYRRGSALPFVVDGAPRRATSLSPGATRCECRPVGAGPRTRAWALLWDTVVLGGRPDPPGSSFCALLGNPGPLSEPPPRGSDYEVLAHRVGGAAATPGPVSCQRCRPGPVPGAVSLASGRPDAHLIREDSGSGKRSREEGAPSRSRRADGGQGSTRAVSSAQHGARRPAATPQVPTGGGRGSGGPAGDRR